MPVKKKKCEKDQCTLSCEKDQCTLSCKKDHVLHTSALAHTCIYTSWSLRSFAFSSRTSLMYSPVLLDFSFSGVSVSKEVKKGECISLLTRSLKTFNKLSPYWPSSRC